MHGFGIGLSAIFLESVEPAQGEPNEISLSWHNNPNTFFGLTITQLPQTIDLTYFADADTFETLSITFGPQEVDLVHFDNENTFVVLTIAEEANALPHTLPFLLGTG